MVAMTTNRAIEELVDEYWRPPDFFTAYVIIDDNDCVVKYRKEKQWFACGKKTAPETLIEHLNLIF